MLLFWIAAGLLAAAAAAVIVYFAARAPAAEGPDPAAQVYERQLAEIDEQVERGILGEEDKKAARAEALRRILGTRQAAAPSPSTTSKARGVVVAGAALACVLAAGVYLAVGRPGLADQPFEDRLEAWRANPMALDPERLSVLIEEAAKGRPDDPEPLYLLARTQLSLGRVDEAAHNLRKAVRLAPDNAAVWSLLGEALSAEARAELPAEARAAFQRAVQLDPSALEPRYALARDQIARGQVDEGLAGWRALLPDLENEEQRQTLSGMIAEVEKDGSRALAGLQVNAPPEVLAMVQGLSERLKRTPNDPEGWALLVRSYAQLGDKARMEAALAEARHFYRDRPDLLAPIEAQADIGR